MKVLIFGGAGFVGSNLVRRCLGDPRNDITVVDSLTPQLHSTTESLLDIQDQIQFIRGDICDDFLVEELVRDQDVIFNCAAQTSHPRSLEEPLFDAEINCIGNLKLLEAVRQYNPRAVVVYPSCSTIIGRAQRPVVDETHGERPLDIYSANKSVAEKYYQIYCTAHDVRTVVLRFANLYGPYGKGFPEFGFVNYFIYLAAEGRDITVYGDGHQTRNVMYIADAVEILYRSAFNRDLYGKLLFATHDEHLSVMQIAQKICTAFGQSQVVQVPWPDMRKRIEIDGVRISSQQLRQLTGWYPRFTFDEGIVQTRTILEKARQFA